MPAYFPDNTHGAVMIRKIGRVWGVYPLEEVKVWTKAGFIGEKIVKMKFKFTQHPMKTWSYKPYEDDDALSSPDSLIGHVRNYAFHKIRHAPQKYTRRV